MSTRQRVFLLNDSRMLCVNPGLAAEIGLNESIVLLQLEYLIGTSGVEREGRVWTYQSTRDLRERYFPWWSADTINRTLKCLQEAGYIVVGRFNQHKYDRTRWFALNYEKLRELRSLVVVQREAEDRPLPAETERRRRKRTASGGEPAPASAPTVAEAADVAEVPAQDQTQSTQDRTRSTQNRTTIPENHDAIGDRVAGVSCVSSTSHTHDTSNDVSCVAKPARARATDSGGVESQVGAEGRDSASKVKQESPGDAEKRRREAIVLALEEHFAREAGIPAPIPRQDGRYAERRKRWLVPLGDIAELAGWDLQRAKRLVTEAVEHMNREKLTISSPQSIREVAIHVNRQRVAARARVIGDGVFMMPVMGGGGNARR